MKDTKSPTNGTEQPMATAQQQDTQQLTELLKSCVHCGFCNATCPSYQVIGNELDGPRGRIYQIANMLSGESDDPSIRQHLDTCLYCRNCVTTCPSSVDYARIFSRGKEVASKRYPYSTLVRLKQSLLVMFFGNPIINTMLFRSASRIRFFLPKRWRNKIPNRQRLLPLVEPSNTQASVLLLQGCIQPGAQPNTNRALINLCARLHLAVHVIEPAGCCGALPHHLNHEQKAMERAKANIDACQPHIESGAVAIVMAASACVLELKEYPELLRHNPKYAQLAQAFVALVKEPAQLLMQYRIEQLQLNAATTLAFHPPCTLQHGLQTADITEELLQRCGFELQPIAKKNLCCGSAGTYSLFQPEVAKELRREKTHNLQTMKPQYIATANIGCQLFLQETSAYKVWHWLELVEHQANKQLPRYTSTP